MNVILTGVTGTLGSQVFYELLQQDNINHIFLPAREKDEQSALQRVQKILDSHAAPAYVSENKDLIAKKLKVLDMEAFFKPETFLSKDETNFFIHSAGSVRLSTDESKRDSIFEGVYGFTKNIFDTFSPYVTKFTYISTAFSIGNIGGLIDNDYHDGKETNHRNFYEEAKHKTEKYLLKEGKENNVDIQILRPSILGGNIFENSPHFISSYMVYYLIGKFFYKNPLGDSSMRLTANDNSKLNVIPVDYVAKVIAKVYQQPIAQLNIVHAKGTNVAEGMERIIKTVDFNNLTLVNASRGAEFLKDKNKLEEIYYSSIGLHLNLYFTAEPSEYDTTLLESILPMPEYNLMDYLENTISYAKAKDFEGEDW